MMQITLNFLKTIEQNAALYFEKAKKAKKKKEGAEKALAISKKKLEEALREEQEREEEQVKQQQQAQMQQAKKDWYEKFHWFYSSEGFLVIGGRDAITNELVIKKHAQKGDFVFHTDMQGSPFFVIKTEGKQAGEKTLEETAAATALFSRAWKLGFVNVRAGWVLPEQVSKTAKHGEYLTRGAFIISGKMHYVEHDMRFAIGIKEGKIISGPYAAVAKHAEKFVEIVQGNEKPSNLAKKLKSRFQIGTIDEIIRMLPAGNGRIKE